MVDPSTERPDSAGGPRAGCGPTVGALRFIQTQVQQRSPIVIALQERSQVIMRANVRGYRQGLNADMVYYDRVTK